MRSGRVVNRYTPNKPLLALLFVILICIALGVPEQICTAVRAFRGKTLSTSSGWGKSEHEETPEVSIPEPIGDETPRPPNDIDKDLWSPEGKKYLTNIEAPAFKSGYFGHEYVFENLPYFNETLLQAQKRFAKTKLKKKTIFVMIPSYRDPNCNGTLTEIYSKCKHCQNIYVGICNQLDFDEDKDSNLTCFGSPTNKYRKNIRMANVEHKYAAGPTFARYITSKLWDGEEYILGIDSHSFFVQDWDELLIHDYNHVTFPSKEIEAKWVNYENPKHVLTTYPQAHSYTLGSQTSDHVAFICAAEYDQDKKSPNFQQKASTFLSHDQYHQSHPALMLGAGFMFAHANIFRDAPFDRFTPMLFHGEEQYLYLRLYTRGWNFFLPPRNYISHKYGGRPLNVYQKKEKWWEFQKKSQDRALYLLGYKTEKPEYDDELESFALGTERTVKEWELFADIYPSARSQGNRCAQRFDYVKNDWVKKEYTI